MITRAEVWEHIFHLPDNQRTFDENRPWWRHPRAGDASDDGRTVTVSQALLAATEILGMAAMRGWNLDDARDRDRLRAHLEEAGQLLDLLALGVREHDGKQEP